MKIYLAGSFNNRARLRRVRERLEWMGHEVTSRWLEESPRPLYLLAEEFEEVTARKDEFDVAQADIIIVDSIIASTTGGNHVEFGLAGGLSKPRWLVGPIRNIFHRLANRRFASWKKCFEYLEAMQ